MRGETEALATYLAAQAETLRCIAGHPSLGEAPEEVRDASKEVARSTPGSLAVVSGQDLHRARGGLADLPGRDRALAGGMDAPALGRAP